MAKPSNVVFRFSGNTRDFDRAVKGVKGELGGLKKVGGIAGKALGVAAGAGVAALGAAAVKGSLDFSNAYSTIERATGKTGDDLKALEQEFGDVFRSSHRPAEELAGVLGDIDTRFKGTAEQVGALTGRVADFADVAGGDPLTISTKLGQAANVFGEDITGASNSLDVLTKVGQDYGVSGDEILGLLQKQGKNFAALGLSLDESAVAMGELSAAGIDIRSMGSGLERFIGQAVEAGKNPAEAFGELERRIKFAASAEDALAIATDALGDKAGVQLVNAVGQGVSIMGDFSDKIQASKGGLDEIAASSETMEEKFGRLQNSVMGVIAEVALPIAEQLIPVLVDLIDNIMPSLTPLIETLGEIIGQLAPIIGKLLEKLAPLIDEALKVLADLLDAVLTPALELVSSVFDAMVPILDMVFGTIKDTLIPVIKQLLPPIMRVATALIEQLLPIFQSIWPVIEDLLEPALAAIVQIVTALEEPLTLIIGLLGGVLGTTLEGVMLALEPIISLVAIAIGLTADALETLIGWISDGIDWLVKWTEEVGALEKIKEAFEGIKKVFKNVINFLIDAWNALDWTIDVRLPNWLPGIGGKGIYIADVFPDIPRLAEGGIVTEPTLALVGEGDRDEAIVPLPPGYEQGGMMEPQVINNYYTINAQGIGERDLGRMIVAAIKDYEKHGAGLRQFRPQVA